jgi:enoyl-CoA hydratase/carnithine racemase
VGDPLVLTDLIDGVAVISLNRPDRHNAVNDAMGAEWAEALDWALADDTARVVVLRGEGPSFCSGRDVTELGTRAEGLSDFEFVRRAQQRHLQILTSTKPFIAAVKGYALGGGFERALCADIRIGTPDAAMALPEVVLSGRHPHADEALAWGVLNRVVPNDELDEVVLDLARTIASHSPLAVSMGKQLVDQMWSGALQRGIQGELVAQTALFNSQDYLEARAALREQRPPRFEGR